MIFYLLPFLISFVLVYFFIPITKKWAVRWNLIDRPGGRKMHHAPIPLSGGIAVYLGVVVTLLTLREWQAIQMVVVLGGFLLILVGIIDDRWKGMGKDFPAWPKLLVQVAVATGVFWSGIRLHGIRNFFSFGQYYEEYIPFPLWLSFAATLLWIVGMMNMINFLDGLDGLAGGVTAISAGTLFFIAYVKGQQETAMLATILLGASLAFLRHNFHPATVFLGDAGAMFLGYMLSVIALDGAVKSATFLSIVITVLALGVPVLDTFQVILSRWGEGVAIYKADRRHFHHRLLQYGLSQRQTVYILYFASLLFSVASLLLLYFLR